MFPIPKPLAPLRCMYSKKNVLVSKRGSVKTCNKYLKQDERYFSTLIICTRVQYHNYAHSTLVVLNDLLVQHQLIFLNLLVSSYLELSFQYHLGSQSAKGDIT